MVARCPNGSKRIPVKTGVCVKTNPTIKSKSKSATKKRCKIGTRKDKNGNCVKHSRRIDCTIILYYNNRVQPFHSISGNEKTSIEHSIIRRFHTEEIDIEEDEDTSYGIIRNLNIDNIKLNKKLLIEPDNYTTEEAYAFGKVEVLFKKI